MRIALISDLHLDHWPEGEGWDSYETMLSLTRKVKPGDVVVNAGDTGTWNIHYEMASLFPSNDYIEAQGNHDYYGGTFHNDFHMREVGGLKFFICSLWTNFNNNALCKVISERAINDFKLIKGATVETMTAAYEETLVAMKDYQPHVVVSHFAPTKDATDFARYGVTPLNAFFANDLHKWMLSNLKGLRLWMYGHSHSAMDYKVGHIQVASNPLGYKNENFKSIKDYSPKFITVGK